MRKNHYKILFVFILFAFTIPDTYSIEKAKNIVVFFSLDANISAYKSFLDGLNETLSEDPDQPYNLIIEYMDIRRFSDDNYFKDLAELYNEKYRTINIDLLIAFGPGTYPILKKYRLDEITDSPTIDFDIDIYHSNNVTDPSNLDENIIQIDVNLNFRKTLKTAFELFPDKKDVYIISGCSPTDDYFTSLIHQAAEEFRETHNFIFSTGITLDSTLAFVRTIPQDDIVFITSYMQDSEKIPFSSSLAISLISSQCKGPFFTATDYFVSRGAIGGYIYSFEELGKHAGKIAEEVLNGKPINEITIDEDIYYQHRYDWRQLKKWDLLDSNVIPPDSIIMDKEERFLIEYRWYFLGGLLFLIGQTFLILFLIDLNKRQKAVTRQRSENEQLYRELVREDRLSRMSELTASLSHELNQPLTAILYNAQAGKRFLETGKLDDKQAAEIFENIIEDDKRAGSLISSVRSLMKLEDREKEKVDLNGLIRETVKLFFSESLAKHILIDLKLLDHPVNVFGDKIQLQQVLLNLLFNAANSMENNSPENKKIEIIQHLDNGNVTVSIRDSGSGFDDSLKEKLFKAFVTSRAKGLGIGLAVSRSIIEAHLGVIRAENLSAGGAEFSFKLHLFKDGK